ncbi:MULTISPECIES: hypothetical protein [unclassified Paraburkholderia]|uniref:hypothetical protein n=1 Tax=unclassified Paraburkholderia TaxID=2615204 RepID=UPI001608338C|nr:MULTISPECIES: hypothetical protein [unclassified Paraburkholderia]MBB5444605.1 hypothetical protein [Paraburkholderia sp. WSM4177]MBB5485429.1 hypothetical protein [Paraburkholderia sp. WSM4180]
MQNQNESLTAEQRKQIARIVHADCTLIPGATFYNAAEMAIEATLAQVATPPSPDAREAVGGVTAAENPTGIGYDTDDATLEAILSDDPTPTPSEAVQAVAYCRRDTVFGWQGQLMNAAMMFPSPAGLKDPIALYATPPLDGAQVRITCEIADRIEQMEIIDVKLVDGLLHIAGRLEDGAQIRDAWQPIGTAPKETAVLVYTGCSYEIAHFNTLLDKWVACYDHRHLSGPMHMHWMPLPKAPGADAQPADPDESDLFTLLCEIRAACGDNGERERDELVRYIAGLRDNALEEAAKVCGEIAGDCWILYKGRAPYTGREAGRADPQVQGESDGADKCAAAIRALSQQPTQEG